MSSDGWIGSGWVDSVATVGGMLLLGGVFVFVFFNKRWGIF